MHDPEGRQAQPISRPGRWSISRAAALITGMTAVSTILGLGRDVVIAAVFGAGAGLDAYLVAQGLMNIVLALVAGAVTSVIAPGFDGVEAAAAASLTRIVLLATVLIAGTNLLSTTWRASHARELAGMPPPSGVPTPTYQPARCNERAAASAPRSRPVLSSEHAADRPSSGR